VVLFDNKPPLFFVFFFFFPPPPQPPPLFRDNNAFVELCWLLEPANFWKLIPDRHWHRWSMNASVHALSYLHPSSQTLIAYLCGQGLGISLASFLTLGEMVWNFFFRRSFSWNLPFILFIPMCLLSSQKSSHHKAVSLEWGALFLLPTLQNGKVSNIWQMLRSFWCRGRRANDQRR